MNKLNEKTNNGDPDIVTVEELIDIFKEKAHKKGGPGCGWVTSGTFCPMCSFGV